MNRVILLGRLARDPEMRYTTTNTAVTRFTVAVTRPKINGEDRGADFINCVAWRKLAENIAKYCTKVSQISLEGRIQTDSYEDTNGDRKYRTNVVAEKVTFLGSRQQSGQENGQQFSTNQEAFENAMQESSDPFSDFGNEIELSDDDLPF